MTTSSSGPSTNENNSYIGALDMNNIKRSNVPSLVCAFSASCTTGGTIYAFGIYGDALKKSLNLSQVELASISSTFFIAGLISWIPGMVVDRRGMRFSMCLGGCTGALSTMVYWAVSRQFFVLPHVAVLAVLSLLAMAICLSCGLIVGSIFKLTVVCGGPDTRGSAVGIAKGFVGLGAGVYATIFQALKTEQESALDFLPVIAFFFILCAALPAYVLLPTKAQASPDMIQIETTPLHFRTLYLSLLVLGTVIIVSAISDIMKEHDTVGLSSPADQRDYGKVALILIVWLGPIGSLLFLPRKKAEEVPMKLQMIQQYPHAMIECQQGYDPPIDENVALLHNDDNSSYQNGDSTPKIVVVAQEVKKEFTLPEMLRTPSAWLMLWTTTILVGSGTYKTNNMGEMVESLGFSDSLTPATLAIFSVAQAAARVLTGVSSEAALAGRWNVPRPLFLAIASVISLVAHVMLTISTTSQLAFVIGCTVSGIAFGMAWPLMVLIVGDIFGIEHHGANYMFYDGYTKAIGTLLLSEYVAGTVYEAHVDKQEADGETCFGPACFRKTHLTVAVLSVTCIVASLALQYTSRHVYASNSHKRK
jgi:MFS family permease